MRLLVFLAAPSSQRIGGSNTEWKHVDASDLLHWGVSQSLCLNLIGGLWSLWSIYWLFSASGVKATRHRESMGSRLLHFCPMLLAGVLLAAPDLAAAGFLSRRFVAVSAFADIVGSTAVLLGLALCVWARVHLGRNWSGRISLKQDHELIRTGPYAAVRHPIYSGLLLAMCGTAWVRGEWRGLLAVGLMTGSYWRKLRLEERLLDQTFGDAYRDYCRRTAALIPLRWRAVE
jgi:protein-S-isoprenylcysteine O-methyltransferase Ste14